MPRSGGRSSGGGGRSSSGGGGRSFSGGAPPSRSYSTSKPYSSPTKPPPPKPSTPPTGGNTGQPSMMKHIAGTAAGVAAGSLLASAILGAGRESIPPGVECSDRNCKIPEDDPCAKELRNFIDCAYNAQEITACDGYNTLLKECRRWSERQK